MSDHLAPALRRNLAQALRQNQPIEAEAILQQLKAAGDVSAEAQGLELEVLLLARRLTEAASLCQTLLAGNPASSRIHYLAGRLAYLKKQYAEAVEAFRESVHLHDHWKNRWWLAKALTQHGALDEAEALLTALCPTHALCQRDLAWLYERKGALAEARRAMAAYLAAFPHDRFANQQMTRLRGQEMAPEDLVEEVGMLRALGQPAPPELLAEYLKALFVRGETATAQQVVSEQLAQDGPPRISQQLAWVCYHVQRYDLALDLFIHALPVILQQFKALNALERCAKACKREPEAIAAFERYAETQPKLYGRSKRLAKG